MVRKNLIQLRKNKCLKQEDVAKYVEITTSYYGMIEQGVRNPSLEIANKIANFFNTDINKIFFND